MPDQSPIAATLFGGLKTTGELMSDPFGPPIPPRFENYADERLVDHRGRAAALGDENFSAGHGRPFRWLLAAAHRRAAVAGGS